MIPLADVPFIIMGLFVAVFVAVVWLEAGETR